MGIVPVTLGTVAQLSKVQMKMLSNLKDKKNLEKIQMYYYTLLERFNYEPPLLDPVTDMEINDTDFSQLVMDEVRLKTDLDKYSYLTETEKNQFLEYQSL